VGRSWCGAYATALLGLDKQHASIHFEDPVASMEKPAAGAHRAHGGSTTGPSSEKFSRMTTELVELYRISDGSVYPRRQAVDPAPATPADPHAGHDMANMPAPDISANKRLPQLGAWRRQARRQFRQMLTSGASKLCRQNHPGKAYRESQLPTYPQ
jgi:hypothetical protein